MKTPQHNPAHTAIIIRQAKCNHLRVMVRRSITYGANGLELRPVHVCRDCGLRWEKGTRPDLKLKPEPQAPQPAYSFTVVCVLNVNTL
jgi:hypothetical protein